MHGLEMWAVAPGQHNRSARNALYGKQVRSARLDALDACSLEFIATLRDVVAVDLGCGEGEQAIAMASAGAYVAAVDQHDYARAIRRRLVAQGLPPSAITFYRTRAEDAQQLLRRGLPAPDVLYCQRMLHYLPYLRARAVLIAFKEKMKPGSRLYLGLSGIRSELGRGYLHSRRPPQFRFGVLAPEVAESHHITAPICLYDMDDALVLITSAGFSPLSAITSKFGNLKLVAEVI